MMAPKYPGQLIEKMNASKNKHMKHRKHEKTMPKRKHRKTSPLTGLKEGSPKDMKMDTKLASSLKEKHMKHEKVMCKGGEHCKHEKKHKAMTPKTAMGKAQVKKLGRTKKTGGFGKIAKAAGKEYGSKAAGKRVAGAVFQSMARAKHKK